MPAVSDDMAELAGWACSTGIEELPEPVVEHVRHVLLDTLTAIVCGVAADEVRATIDALPGLPEQDLSNDELHRCDGFVRVPGATKRLEVTSAAFVLGLAVSWHDMDETHFEARQHVAAHVVPAALATAQQVGATGAELLRAIALAYEVSARVSAATSLRRDVLHSSGTYGTIGAATVAALLSGADEAQALAAMNIASSMTVASSLNTVVVGASARNTFTAQAARNGVTAPLLARAGVRGDPDGVAHVFSRVSGTAFHGDVARAGLGDDFLVMRNFVKRWAACADAHAPLMAMMAALEGHDTTSDPVVGVSIAMPGDAVKILARAHNETELGSKFSVPYLVACHLVGFDLGSPSAFEGSVRCDRRIAELMPRVDLSGSLAPAEQLASEAEVRLASGKVLTGDARLDLEAGEGTLPQSGIVAKFRRLCTPLIGPTAVEDVVAFVNGLERRPTIDPLLELLRWPADA